MGIKINNSFSFNSNKPNFERDIINSELFESKYPFVLTVDERANLGKTYDIGHRVWDIYTKKEYTVLNTEVNGENYYCLGHLSFHNKTVTQNEIDETNGILTLNNGNNVIELITVIYIPITSQPNDWQTNYNQYLIFKNNQFDSNTSETFDTTINQYYKKVNYNTGDSIVNTVTIQSYWNEYS